MTSHLTFFFFPSSSFPAWAWGSCQRQTHLHRQREREREREKEREWDRQRNSCNAHRTWICRPEFPEHFCLTKWQENCFKIGPNVTGNKLLHELCALLPLLSFSFSFHRLFNSVVLWGALGEWIFKKPPHNQSKRQGRGRKHFLLLSERRKKCDLSQNRQALYHVNLSIMIRWEAARWIVCNKRCSETLYQWHFTEARERKSRLSESTNVFSCMQVDDKNFTHRQAVDETAGQAEWKWDERCKWDREKCTRWAHIQSMAMIIINYTHQVIEAWGREAQLHACETSWVENFVCVAFIVQLKVGVNVNSIFTKCLRVVARKNAKVRETSGRVSEWRSA